MINISEAIADLQAQWHILLDLDRAEAVLNIHQSGVSLRRLAKALNCSEALLRHLLLARDASPEELVLARQGQISTWELARRSAAKRAARPSVHPEISEFEMTNAAIMGCETVRRWFAEQSLDNSYGVQVIRDARLLLANAEKARKLPPGKAPNGLTHDEIIRQCQPVEPKTHNAEVISWYARWLAIWAFYAIPNARAREQALDLAMGLAR
jgi:hypothetical protein